MLSHDTIWKAVERLAERHGYSASGLARKAGLDPTAFNRSKRRSPDGKPRWPSTESIALILTATGTDLPDFVALMRDEPPAAPESPTLPLLPLTHAGMETCFDAQGRPDGPGWTRTRLFRGADTGDGEVYALEVSGRAHAPLYRDGDRLIVAPAPAAALRRSDRAVVRLQDGTLLLGDVTRRTATKLALRLASGEMRTLSAAEIVWSGRILWASQ